MKLSEAMMLGDSLRIRDSSLFLIVKGSACFGCALGGALLSVGVSYSDKCIGVNKLGYLEYFQTLWAWMDDKTYEKINHDFILVCIGDMTFEQLVDYIVSIEPDCGECNRFDCTCKPAELPVEEVQNVERSEK